MADQMTFKRYELKYLLTPPQKEAVLRALETEMSLDSYGRTTIRNLYFDTDTFRLIRRSLEHPVYKEKLRVRSYRRAGETDRVFVELKKKSESVVYKRRMAMPQAQALLWLSGDGDAPPESQIAKEIEYFRRFYSPLFPRVFLSYEREAFFDPAGSDLRVTLDEAVLYRRDALSLDTEPSGVRLLPPGTTLMEVKTSGGFPLWMAHLLSRERIFKTTFSKYGAAYQHMLQIKFSERKEESLYA